MYAMEIKDENFDILTVIHFMNLIKAYDFVRNFNHLHWAWDTRWQHIYVYRITTNEYGNEGLIEERIQFTISREAYEELKR